MARGAPRKPRRIESIGPYTNSQLDGEERRRGGEVSTRLFDAEIRSRGQNEDETDLRKMLMGATMRITTVGTFIRPEIG